MVVELLVIGLDLAFTVLLTLFAIPVGNYYHYWAPFLLLVGGYLLGVAIMWCVLSLFALPYDKKKEYEKPSKWANFWLCEAMQYIDFHAGAKVKVNYHVNFPTDSRYLLVCNHLSKFDPMILAAIYKKDLLAFISKPTNFKIPIGGHFMKASCYLPIDRYDKLKSLEVMKRASELIESDKCSIGVFPEGTRSEDGKLGEFHEGVFAIAMKSKCPIVIMTVKGTENIHHNFPKRRTKVVFDVLEVMNYEDYQSMIVKQISDHAYQVMKNNLECD